MTSSTPSETRTIPFARPWVTEEDRSAVDAVLQGHILTHGPEGERFAEEFAEFMGDGAHCVTVSSCMAALHLACLHFGLGPGDEVVVPAQTHAATAHAVEWVGATPVFADCEAATGNMTAETIEAVLTERAKAILLVHYAGIPCDMPAILALAERHRLRVIEDCALAVGARYDGRHVGLLGDAGCYSFYPVKHLTTAEGGMFVSRYADVAAHVARLRAFGVDRTHSERSVPGMYDVTMLGLNYRMSEPQAALGRSQLRRVGENLARRRENFITIAGALADVDGVTVIDATDERAQSSWYCLTALLEPELAVRRLELIEELKRRGVGTSLYYPQPVPRMGYYAEKYGYERSRWPNAEAISDRSIALPVGPHVSRDDAEYVADAAAEVLAS